MASMNIRKNDTVEVIVGPTEGDRAVKGKRGKVILVDLSLIHILTLPTN